MKKSERKSTTDKAAVAIRRLWGDLPVVDAERDLRVIMGPDDVKSAVPKDPMNCVFARACRRLYRSSKVLFLRSTAYVDLPQQDGTRRVERFELPRGMRDLIDDFDRGKGVIPEGGFLLLAPTPGRRMDRRRLLQKRERDRRAAAGLSRAEDRRKERDREQERGRRAALLGTTEGIGRGKGKYRDELLAIDGTVRNGTGLVHFNCKGQADT